MRSLSHAVSKSRNDHPRTNQPPDLARRTFQKTSTSSCFNRELVCSDMILGFLMATISMPMFCLVCKLTYEQLKLIQGSERVSTRFLEWMAGCHRPWRLRCKAICEVEIGVLRSRVLGRRSSERAPWGAFRAAAPAPPLFSQQTSYAQTLYEGILQAPYWSGARLYWSLEQFYRVLSKGLPSCIEGVLTMTHNGDSP